MQIVLVQTLRYAVDFFKCILWYFVLGGIHIELIFIFFLRHQQAAVMPQRSLKQLCSHCDANKTSIMLNHRREIRTVLHLAFSYMLGLFSSILYHRVPVV